MAFSKHSVPRLVAATLLLTVTAALPRVAAQDPRNASEFADWCHSQGLEVSYNPPRCSAVSTEISDTYGETPPTQAEIEALRQAREQRRQAQAERRQARESSRQVDARYAELRRLWAQVQRLTSTSEKGRAFRYVLEQARRQQAIRDGASLREFIGRIEAHIMWTDGIIEEEHGNYLVAAANLDRAIRHRPDLFNDENRRYISALVSRSLAGPNRSVAVIMPPADVAAWNNLHMFVFSPEGVNERVRWGFQAIEAGDWNAARTWFQDALNRDPDNAQIRAYLEMDPETSTHSSAARADAFGHPLPETFTLSTLQEHALTMDDAQIRSAMYNIVLDQRLREATRMPPPVAPSFQHSGNGLIGGTAWQIGFYSPVGASAEVRARAVQMLREQSRAAGHAYEEAIDFDRYNFVLGVANSPSVGWDLSTRVWRDQFTNGQATANSQGVYNSLRGRHFDELGCHSNGAMICLAALMNQEVQASNVVLYGPQITPASIDLWNELLCNGRIDSLEIVIAQNDLVPPASLLFSPVSLLEPYAAVLAAPILYNVNDLAAAVRMMSPGATVSTFSCASQSLFGCHDMIGYANQRRLSPRAHDPRPAVAGTRITGDPNSRPLLEPPNPACG